MKSTSLASRLSGYSVDGRKRFVKDLSHFQSASVDGPLKMLATYLTFYFILIAVSLQTTPKRKRSRVGEGSEGQQYFKNNYISSGSSLTLNTSQLLYGRTFRCALYL